MKVKAAVLAAAIGVLCVTVSCRQEEVESPRAAASSAEPIEFQFRPTEGDRHREKFIMERTRREELSGETRVLAQHTEIGLMFEVVRAEPDQPTVVRVTHESVLVEQKGPRGTLRYDSSDPPSPIPRWARLFDALVGKGFRIKVSADGEVEGIYGTDELVSAMVEHLPEGPARDRARERAKEQFGPAVLKRMMNVQLGYFPGKPVAPGDRWTERFALSGSYPVLVERTYTLRKVSGGKAYIDQRSAIRPDPEAEPARTDSATVRVKLSGSQEGSIVASRETGWLVRAEIDQTMSGTVELRSTEQPERRGSYPVEIKARYTIESVE